MANDSHTTMDPQALAATGAGVRVALIDSGVNAQHPHVGFVSGGTAFAVTPDGALQQSDQYTDRLGHGTALAGILRAKAPGVEIYAVKIFADRLAAPFAVLAAGLRWAIEQHMHVINLSLGTDNPAHRERLSALVARAKDANALLVASSPPGRADVLPAALPGVIGAAGDEECQWGVHRYVPADPIPLRAHPHPRALPGLPQARNFRGHSFASAHIAAVLALLREQRPQLTVEEAQGCLRRTSNVALFSLPE
jgi:hypothetical protein